MVSDDDQDVRGLFHRDEGVFHDGQNFRGDSRDLECF